MDLFTDGSVISAGGTGKCTKIRITRYPARRKPMMEHDDTCQCFDCIDARIDEQHDGAIEKLEKAAQIEEQRRKERVDRVRARRESHEQGMQRERDPSAPSLSDLRSMFDFDE